MKYGTYKATDKGLVREEEKPIKMSWKDGTTTTVMPSHPMYGMIDYYGRKNEEPEEEIDEEIIPEPEKPKMKINSTPFDQLNALTNSLSKLNIITDDGERDHLDAAIWGALNLIREELQNAIHTPAIKQVEDAE
jgi:hypothetical protein